MRKTQVGPCLVPLDDIYTETMVVCPVGRYNRVHLDSYPHMHQWAKRDRDRGIILVFSMEALPKGRPAISPVPIHISFRFV